MENTLICCDNNLCRYYVEGNKCSRKKITLQRLYGEEGYWIYCKAFKYKKGEKNNG